METIDTLLELRLLGGEPFLFSQLDRIIDAFIDNDKIKQITIYTNSTMLPTENVLKSLQRKKYLYICQIMVSVVEKLKSWMKY